MKKTVVTHRLCGPCKALKSHIEANNIEVNMVDAETEEEFLLKHNIRSVPTLVVEFEENGCSAFAIYSNYNDIIKNL